MTIAQGKAQNKLGSPDGTPKRSTFEDLSAHHYTTERFGINDVCFLYNGLAKDQVEIRPTYELDTYTLNAPLMTNVYKERDYFIVPRQAILPFNWDKIYTQPTAGDDVDFTEVGTSVPGETIQALLTDLKLRGDEIVTDLENAIGGLGVTFGNAWTYLLRYQVICEKLFSYGSLCSKMGCNFAGFINIEFDKVFDSICLTIKNGVAKVLEVEDGNGEKYLVSVDDFATNKNASFTFREFLEWLRDDPYMYVIKKFYNANNEQCTNEGLALLTGTIKDKFEYNTKVRWETPVDTAFFWAYQLVNAEFYTEDKVDYIYSAELFRQYVSDIIVEEGVEGSNFIYNGIKCQYDYLSAYYFKKIIEGGNERNIDLYLTAMLTHKRSLKYKDYFAGAKTQPLVTGDMTIAPDQYGNIEVINVTKAIQAQRFQNAVRRYGRKIEEYTLGLMGIKPRVDFHNPLWIAGTRTALKNYDTENTGEAQIENANAVTSKMKGIDGNYQFKFDLDRNAIVIGISYYDLERSYGKSIKRMFFHVDRYDMFNPYLQYTGDQPIFAAEYQAGNTGNYFGYQPAYEEFKQDYNIVSGGFMVDLPGYTFIDSVNTDNRAKGDTNKTNHIGPDFIRSYPAEFDRFYNSLTGYSLATHKHFIVDYMNHIKTTRNMSYNPSIL